MDSEKLRIFLAAAETGSFSAAAARLYISHSTVSRALSALEEELGTELLHRSGNRCLGLTPAGEVMLTEARALLAAAETAAERVKAAAAGR